VGWITILDTLAYRYDLVTQVYESFKPIDPDTIPNFTNQLWRVEQAPDGRVFAVGRTHYIYNNLHYRKALIQSFDGENWHLHPIPENFSQGYDNYVWGLSIHETGQVYTVGRFREPGIYTPNTLVLKTDEISGSHVVTDKPGKVQLEMAGSNPFQGNTALRLYLTQASHVKLEIIDVFGKQIRLLLDQKMHEGWTTIDWDGLDNRGQQASSGVYLFILSANSGTAMLKVLKYH
jgi:hypothetical protein